MRSQIGSQIDNSQGGRVFILRFVPAEASDINQDDFSIIHFESNYEGFVWFMLVANNSKYIIIPKKQNRKGKTRMRSVF